MSKNKEEKQVAKKKTYSQKSRDQRKATVLTILKRNLGNIKEACEIARVTPQTYYNWLSSDEEFQQKIETMERIKINLAESKLDEHIYNEEDPKVSLDATKFYLDRKGKKYGWSNKDVQENKEVKPLTLIINTDSDDNDNVIDMNDISK